MSLVVVGMRKGQEMVGRVRGGGRRFLNHYRLVQGDFVAFFPGVSTGYVLYLSTLHARGGVRM